MSDSISTKHSRRISIAPMMQYTNRHFRYFIRLMNPSVWLYTEMITAETILHAKNADALMNFDSSEHPLALQLGGSDPEKLAYSTALAVEKYGYDEVNLNVGCPSDRVKSGRFGACLMKEPEQVARCVEAMRAVAKGVPVTVKTRIGVDDIDSYDNLKQFVSIVHAAGCQTFIIHARKAWLKGLSPRQNRTVPPLRYDVVYQIKQDFPALEILVNGGIKTDEDINTHLDKVDGVMIGREACRRPYWFAEMLDEADRPTREVVMAKYRVYMDEQLEQGASRQQVTKPLLGLFTGTPGARTWRRELTKG